MSGSPRVTIIPLFILAGSKAQLDNPTKATLSSRSIRCIVQKCVIEAYKVEILYL